MSVVEFPVKSRSFDRTISSKWVLAGEHAVMRGRPSIVMPNDGYTLRLRFQPGGESLEVEPRAIEEISRVLIGLFEEVAKKPIKDRLKGRLEIQSNVPIGAGFGSSAALCVGIASWLGEQLRFSQDEIFKVAVRLEDYFHGESSGMDIAQCLYHRPLQFQKEMPIEVLDLDRTPNFRFFDTEIRTRTKEAIARVKQLWVENETRALEIDDQMTEAVNIGRQGLQTYSTDNVEKGLSEVAQCMEMAQDCFKSWDLVHPRVDEMIQEIKRDHGALAVKLTGAGLGGFLVALLPG